MEAYFSVHFFQKHNFFSRGSTTVLHVMHNYAFFYFQGSTVHASLGSTIVVFTFAKHNLCFTRCTTVFFTLRKAQFVCFTQGKMVFFEVFFFKKNQENKGNLKKIIQKTYDFFLLLRVRPTRDTWWRLGTPRGWLSHAPARPLIGQTGVPINQSILKSVLPPTKKKKKSVLYSVFILYHALGQFTVHYLQTGLGSSPIEK